MTVELLAAEAESQMALGGASASRGMPAADT